MDLLNDLKRTARPWICPFDLLLASVPHGASVFDIGCGTGFFLSLIADTKKSAKLGGAEISPSLVRAAQEHLSGKGVDIPISIGLYDGVNLPVSIKTFDVVTLVDVLHHVPPANQRTFLETVQHAMADGATLILKDIDAGRPILCLFNKLHDFLSSGAPGHEWSRENAAEILQSLGFEIVSRWEARRLCYPHYCLVCRKKGT